MAVWWVFDVLKNGSEMRTALLVRGVSKALLKSRKWALSGVNSRPIRHCNQRYCPASFACCGFDVIRILRVRANQSGWGLHIRSGRARDMCPLVSRMYSQ